MEAYLGVDISKKTFDVMLLLGKGKHKKFPNTQEGCEELSVWLTRFGVTHVHACMEATSRYWRRLAEYLHFVGHKVSVVNPSRVWGFRKSETLGRMKTDKLDAGVIARFCEALKPEAWQPPLPEIQALKDMVTYAAHIQEQIVAEKNRQHVGALALQTAAAIERHIRFLEGNLEQLRNDMQLLIKKHAHLRQKVKLLVSIPGIGKETAAVIIGEVFAAGEFKSERGVACYAGLSPKHGTSGTSVNRHSRLTKIGNKRLRKALYFPAICIWRDRSLFPEFIEEMVRRGKHKMVIIGAIMRKLLCLCYKILKTEREYNPNYLRPINTTRRIKAA
jgi:transposase